MNYLDQILIGHLTCGGQRPIGDGIPPDGITYQVDRSTVGEALKRLPKGDLTLLVNVSVLGYGLRSDEYDRFRLIRKILYKTIS